MNTFKKSLLFVLSFSIVTASVRAEDPVVSAEDGLFTSLLPKSKADAALGIGWGCAGLVAGFVLKKAWDNKCSMWYWLTDKTRSVRRYLENSLVKRPLSKVGTVLGTTAAIGALKYSSKNLGWLSAGLLIPSIIGLCSAESDLEKNRTDGIIKWNNDYFKKEDRKINANRLPRVNRQNKPSSIQGDPEIVMQVRQLFPNQAGNNR